jgi:hypothetical protein
MRRVQRVIEGLLHAQVIDAWSMTFAGFSVMSTEAYSHALLYAALLLHTFGRTRIATSFSQRTQRHHLVFAVCRSSASSRGPRKCPAIAKTANRLGSGCELNLRVTLC